MVDMPPPRRHLRFVHWSRLVHRIMSERTTPVRTGFAVGLGVAIGTSPFFGFHLAICLAAATILGLNRAITYIAANISVPWIAPFLIFASVQTGNFILQGSLLSVDLHAVAALDPWRFGAAWGVGSLVVGTVLGVPAGLGAFVFTRAYRRRHPLAVDPAQVAFAATVKAYADCGRFAQGYVRGKLKLDLIFRQLVA